MRNVNARKMTFLVFGLLVLLLGSCDILGIGTSSNSSTSSSGSLTFQGQTTTLTNLYTRYFWVVTSGAHNIDIEITPSTLNYDTLSGSGRSIYLEMFFPTTVVTSGTYIFDTDGSENAGTFSALSCIYTDGYNDYEDLTGGTVTISISGSTYTVTGTVTTGLGSATFSYTGPIIID